VGPRPFRRDDRHRFFGRDREAVDLKYRVMAHPVTLLYAMSGAGKTSLVNAMVIPMLELEGCRVLPVARVRGSTRALEPGDIPNIFVFHAVSSWQDQETPELAQRLADRTLEQELTTHAGTGDEDEPLLITVFDQFEELFTAFPDRWADRRGFFEQLAAALGALPQLRVLLAMREDFLAAMDPFAALLPDRLRTRCRLERLRRDAALEAIVKPLAGTGLAFAPHVADQLVDNLLRIYIRPQVEDEWIGGECEETELASLADAPGATGELTVATAEYVEPVQLQVVCQNLWQNLRPEEHVIAAEHLASCGQVNQALARFYDRCVASAALTGGVSEGAVRRWFGQQLITPAGTRGLVLQGRTRTGRMPNAAVAALESDHLIRCEDRGGSRWYELAHDRFIEPIQNSNRHWHAHQPGHALWKELEERAALWHQAGQTAKPRLLLNEADLARAEEWHRSRHAVELEPSDRLRQFLEASRGDVDQQRLEAEIKAERGSARARARLIGFLVLVSFVFCVLLVGAVSNWVKAYRSEARARRFAELEGIRGLATQAALKISTDPRGAVQDVQDALTRARDQLGGDPDGTIAAPIRPILSRAHQRSELDHSRAALAPRGALSTQGEARAVSFAPAELTKGSGSGAVPPCVAVGGTRGLVRVWDLGDPTDPGDDRCVSELDLSRSVDRGGTPPVNLDVRRLAFDAEGRCLAIATGDHLSRPGESGGEAWIWEHAAGTAGKPACLRLAVFPGPVADTAFSPDGTQVAIAGRCPSEDGGSPAPATWDGVVAVYDRATAALKGRHRIRGEPANNVAFDRTGQWLAAACGDANEFNPKRRGGVVVVDLTTGEAKRVEAHDCPSARARFSPDGRLIVSGATDGVLRVHRVDNRQLIAILPGHNQPIEELDFSHDGSRLLSASGDRTARIWDAGGWLDYNPGAGPREWSSLVTLVGHKAALIDAEFSPDSTLVLTTAYDRTARVWDARTGEGLVTLVGHDGPVLAGEFNPEGTLVATAAGPSARVWAVGQVELPRLQLAAHSAAVRDVEFSPVPGSTLALTIGADGAAYLWDVAPARQSAARPVPPPWALRPRNHDAPAALTDAAFSPDGAHVATAAVDGVVRVWDVRSAAEAAPPIRDAGAGAALGVTFSPRGTYLLTTWGDGAMRLFHHQQDGWKQAATPWPGSAGRLSPELFDRDERLLITPTAGLLQVREGNGSVWLWDVAERDQPRKRFTTPEGLGPVADVAIHPAGQQIAAAVQGTPGAVHVWNLDGEVACPPLIHPLGVERVVFSPDGQRLVSEAEDGQGRMWPWRPADGKRPAAVVLTGLTGPQPQLAFSPDGTLLASDGGNLATDAGAGVGLIWGPGGQRSALLGGPRESLLALRFVAGEILTINRADQLKRWKVEHAVGVPVGLCRGPIMRATAAAVSPDGTHAATGASDGIVKIWHTDTGSTCTELKGHSEQITSVAFSPDPAGKYLVTASLDGSARVWPVAETGRRERLVSVAFEHHAPVTAARFLDAGGRKIVTATGDLKRVHRQAPGIARESGTIYRLDLRATSPRNEPERINAVRTLPSGSLAEESPVGVLAAAFSPVSSRVFLACGGKDSTFNIVHEADPETRAGLQFEPEKNARARTPRDFRGHSEAVVDVTVSRDGKLIATASPDNTARVWDARPPSAAGGSSRLLAELRGHSGDVATVRFSPDARYVLTVSRQDGTARVWDARGGEPLYVLGTHRSSHNSAALSDPPGPRQYTDDVACVAFSSDGKLLITGHGDGVARVYRLDLCGGLNDLLEVARQRRLGGVTERSQAAAVRAAEN
jgi:WD40 repeat protein